MKALFMKQKPRSRTPQLDSLMSRPRPGQDIITTKKQASQFPGVGLTMSSYTSDSSQKKGRHNKDQTEEKPSRRKRFFKKLTFKRTVLGLLALLIIAGVLLGSKIVYDLHKAFGGNVLGILSSTRLKGESTGRVNILLAGEAGQNSGQTGGVNLTDSIMLISLDTKNNTGFLMSIPRDLYVNIPNDNGYGKINAVNEDGDSSNFSQAGYPSGGMGLLEKTVSKDFNIPIDYYALIDYDAFKQAVDAVGGITINIQSSDPRGLYDAYTHLKLPNGPVMLNGPQALDLARARGDDVAGDISYGFPDSDFDRTMHQRQMLQALKSKAVTSSVLANPIKISNLFSALGDNLKTDLSLSDARRLYDITKVIPNSKLQSLSLNSANGQDLLANYIDTSGQEDLVPAAGLNDYSQIQQFVAQQTSNNPLVQENAKVVVLNGTSVAGLAANYQQKLETQHLNVNQVGDAESANVTTTQIIETSTTAKPATRKALVKEFGNNITTTNPYSGLYGNPDYIVVLGTNLTTTPASTTQQP
jgi:LCP family protein required for cell wall assembly